MSFAAEVAKFGGETQKRIHNIRRGFIIKLLSAVIMDTPVLEGRLRGNWQLTEEKPADGTIERLDKSGAETINAMTIGVMPTNGEKVLYLTNNLPYAAQIEFDGWSHTKAPKGMVRINVARIQRFINRNPQAFQV